MHIYSVYDPAFKPYGRVVEGFDEARAELAAALRATPLPDATDYVPEDPALQSLPAAAAVRDSLFGGMPAQLGWCNGHNTRLNCLEYHRDSEFNLGAEDFILLLAKLDEVENGLLDTGRVKAFRVPAGVLVEVYATTLHYAPCQVKEDGFRCVIVLPKDTNLPLDCAHAGGEDGHLTAKNKWLLGHPEGGLPEGSPMGLIGENLTVD